MTIDGVEIGNNGEEYFFADERQVRNTFSTLYNIKMIYYTYTLTPNCVTTGNTEVHGILDVA